ncbi:MAG: hypothetical protein OK454_03555 [Thaumarchaeota archaeon]|nr:hypothetical protein [Nitrososphaerota archaeon]
MLVEAAFASLVFLAWRKVRGRRGMTKERRDIYLDALEHMVNPADLRTLADGYESEGLPIEAEMLRKRAELREMPREKWENFRAICERAIQKPDANPQALDEMAVAFEAMTATGTAMKLRKRAAERRMEILAFADDRQREVERAAAEQASKSVTEAPPTPDNSGGAEAKDPDKTIDPSAEVAP